MARPVQYAFPILSSQGSISHRLLHTIFRSGGLIISMFIGWLVSNKWLFFGSNIKNTSRPPFLLTTTVPLTQYLQPLYRLSDSAVGTQKYDSGDFNDAVVPFRLSLLSSLRPSTFRFYLYVLLLLELLVLLPLSLSCLFSSTFLTSSILSYLVFLFILVHRLSDSGFAIQKFNSDNRIIESRCLLHKFYLIVPVIVFAILFIYHYY